MNRRTSLTARLVLALAAMSAGACTGIEVETDWDPAADFAGLQHYAWIDMEPPGTTDFLRSGFLEGRVRAAADPLLAERGLTQTAAETADVLLRAGIVTRNRVEAWSTSFGTGTTHHPWWNGGPIYTDTTLAIYPETRLVLDLVATDGERLLWRGVGELDTRRAETPDERIEAIRATVAAILAEYPPPRD